MKIRLDEDYLVEYGHGIWRYTCIEGWIDSEYYHQGYGQLYFCVPVLIVSGYRFKVVYEYDE